MGSPSTRIWRTVVFAGAMLATPLGGCGSPSHKPVAKPAAESPPSPSADEQRLAAEQAEQQRLAEEKQRIEDERAAEEQRRAEEERLAEEKRVEDEARANAEALRARGSISPEEISRKPRGRGFVLS
jgi:hypothetical protein